ncbi:hypothetical protein O6Y00_20995 [Sphingomonas faeni]
MIHQLFAQKRHVFCVAGQPVERFADNEIDGTGFDVAQQLHQSRSVAAIA